MKGISANLAGTSNTLRNYEQRELQKPTSVIAEPNKVTIVYPAYTLIYEAEGEGLERHNFTMSVSVPDGVEIQQGG